MTTVRVRQRVAPVHLRQLILVFVVTLVGRAAVTFTRTRPTRSSINVTVGYGLSVVAIINSGVTCKNTHVLVNELAAC